MDDYLTNEHGELADLTEAEGNEIVVHYASSHNVTFRGELGTGISRAEWASMSEEEKDQIMEELVWDLVELWVEGY